MVVAVLCRQLRRKGRLAVCGIGRSARCLLPIFPGKASVAEKVGEERKQKFGILSMSGKIGGYSGLLLASYSQGQSERNVTISPRSGFHRACVARR